MSEEMTFLTIPEASKWATDYLKKKVTSSNISYLVHTKTVQLLFKLGGRNAFISDNSCENI